MTWVLERPFEAAYILRELDAHQAIERVLIMVPARLKTKWKKELRQRFDESFDIVKGTDLIEQCEKISKGAESEPFRWIASIESARSDDVRKALESSQLR